MTDNPKPAESANTADQPTRVMVVGEVERPRAPGTQSSAARERSPASQALARRLGWLVPAAVAAPALTAPRTWLLLVALLCLFGGTVRHAHRGGGGSAGWMIAPLSALWDGLRWILHPGRLVLTLFWLLCFALLAVGAPFGLGALRWLIADGGSGALAAGRLAAVKWSPALLAAIVCVAMLRQTFAISHRSPFENIPEGAVVGLTLTSGLALALFVLAFPIGAVTLRQLTPGALRPSIAALDRSWGDAQTREVMTCIRKQTGVRWRSRSRLLADGKSVSLFVDQRRGDQRAHRSDLSALALALHNELLSAVTRITIRRGSKGQGIVIARDTLSLRDRPLRSTTSLATAAGVGPTVLPESAAAARLGLRCGAQFG
jgi:hypothetical protein